jgi:response regulator of citrate/malate metabolism
MLLVNSLQEGENSEISHSDILQEKGNSALDLISVSPGKFPVRVVIVTSSIDGEDERRAEKYSLIEGYLIKPVTPETLKPLLCP